MATGDSLLSGEENKSRYRSGTRFAELVAMLRLLRAVNHLIGLARSGSRVEVSNSAAVSGKRRGER